MKALDLTLTSLPADDAGRDEREALYWATRLAIAIAGDCRPAIAEARAELDRIDNRAK